MGALGREGGGNNTHSGYGGARLLISEASFADPKVEKDEEASEFLRLKGETSVS